MHGSGQSDRPIVPGKRPNNDLGAPGFAEGVEGRGRAKGNPGQQTRSWTLGQEEYLQNALDRVRHVAERSKTERFTSLWHLINDVGRLERAYFALRPSAAPGVDGETWRDYGRDLANRLEDLSSRLRRGAYRARPVKRAYIPKPDGRQRPIGITALEDKIVQRATVEVLNAVYETDFLDFSYGFRTGREPHDALDALTVAVESGEVNWVLDADIRGFFDAISHEWLIKFVEHRIGDQRVVRLIQKWLKAGVLEDGKWHEAEEGTPQGGSASPLLANIYLHYVLDLWIDHWRKKRAQGVVHIVRYADDFMVCFEHKSDAEQFLQELTPRLAKFNLELHQDKTRLLEFGRYAASTRKARGLGKPETFDFLGMTHICSTTRNGKFCVLRRPITKRVRAKIQQIKLELKRRRHWSIDAVGKWLHQVLQGYYRYRAVPRSLKPLEGFRQAILRLWRQALCRRSQRHYVTWDWMNRLARHYLPRPRVLHPYPDQRLHVKT